VLVAALLVMMFVGGWSNIPKSTSKRAIAGGSVDFAPSFPQQSATALADAETTVTVTGTVEDSLDASPVADVHVVVRAGTVEQKTTTDEGGAFSVTIDVGTARSLTLAFSKEAYAPYQQSLAIAAPPVQSVSLETVQLKPIVTRLVGKLVDYQSGAPVTDASGQLFFAETQETYLLMEPEWPTGLFSFSTDATGTYTIEMDSALQRFVHEPYQMCCAETYLYAGVPYRMAHAFIPFTNNYPDQWYGDNRASYNGAESLVFERGSNTVTVPFLTDKPFLRLHLRAVDGAPLAHTFFTYRLYDETGFPITQWINRETDGTGIYTETASPVAPGAYRAVVKDVGRGPLDTTMTDDYNITYYGDTEDMAAADTFTMPTTGFTAEVRLRQSGILQGIVTEAATGAPLAGKKLNLAFYDEAGNHHVLMDERVTLDEEGAFATTPAKSGAFKVLFTIGDEDEEDEYYARWSGNADTMKDAAVLTIPTQNERLELAQPVALKHNPAATLDVSVANRVLAAGEAMTVTVMVKDQAGKLVTGQNVQVEVAVKGNGSLSSVSGVTDNGVFATMLTAGQESGTVLVEAMSGKATSRPVAVAVFKLADTGQMPEVVGTPVVRDMAGGSFTIDVPTGTGSAITTGEIQMQGPTNTESGVPLERVVVATLNAPTKRYAPADGTLYSAPAVLKLDLYDDQGVVVEEGTTLSSPLNMTVSIETTASDYQIRYLDTASGTWKQDGIVVTDMNATSQGEVTLTFELWHATQVGVFVAGSEAGSEQVYLPLVQVL
jgi:hypothetical protein